MKPRVKKHSDARRMDLVRNLRNLSSLTATHPVAPQVCIGDLEEEFHKGFAVARLSGGTDFVYERDCDAYAKLDEFCNWDKMSEPVQPLVVSGPCGSGKSALVANWLVHFRQRLELRRKHGAQMEEPYVFYHAVGCTRHGVDVDQLLWRLLSNLKQRFDLAISVPSEAARLSWDFPRFLELAARKGHVIIVVDGLHHLQDKTGGEIGLQWLPLSVPGNVRVIVTATHPDPHYTLLHERRLRGYTPSIHAVPSFSSGPGNGDGGDICSNTAPILRRETTTEKGIDDMGYASNHRRRKVEMELSRRKWPVLEVGPLEAWRKRNIIEAFFKHSIVGQRSTLQEPRAWRADLRTTTHCPAPTFLTGVPYEDNRSIGCRRDANTESMPGLVLFPSMIEKILSSDATNSVLYLRTLLRLLEWAAVKAYDVRALLETALTTASSVRALYNIFFDRIESGNRPTDASTSAAKEANKADGGLPALQRAVHYFIGRSSASQMNPKRGENHVKSIQTPPRALAAKRGSIVLRKGGVVTFTGETDYENNKQVGQEESKNAEEGGGSAEGCYGGGEETRSDDSSDEEIEVAEERGVEEQRVMHTSDEQAMVSQASLNSSSDTSPIGMVRINPDKQEEFCGKGEANERKGDSNFTRTGPVDTSSAHEVTRSTGLFGQAAGYLTSGLETEEVSFMVEVPIYLAGGAKVEGFGGTVGQALAFLHVVRLGLWPRELWSLLVSLKAQGEARGTEGEAESRLLRKILKSQSRLIDSMRRVDMNRGDVISTKKFRSALVSMGLGLTERQLEILIRAIDTDCNGELDMKHQQSDEGQEV